jgi:hypothetical protein
MTMMKLIPALKNGDAEENAATLSRLQMSTHWMGQKIWKDADEFAKANGYDNGE